MWGWETIEKSIDASVSFEDALLILKDEGFTLHVKNLGHAILRRSGTQFGIKGEKFPIEVAVARAELGLFLQVRYDSFMLFDTGDLQRFSDAIASKLELCEGVKKVESEI